MLNEIQYAANLSPYLPASFILHMNNMIKQKLSMILNQCNFFLNDAAIEEKNNG